MGDGSLETCDDTRGIGNRVIKTHRVATKIGRFESNQKRFIKQKTQWERKVWTCEDTTLCLEREESVDLRRHYSVFREGRKVWTCEDTTQREEITGTRFVAFWCINLFRSGVYPVNTGYTTLGLK